MPKNAFRLDEKQEANKYLKEKFFSGQETAIKSKQLL